MPHYELTLRAEFAAAHQLRMYDGALEPLHGHNWRVEAVFLAPRLDTIGVGADFVVLQRLLHEAVAPFHDRCLNELPLFAGVNPSTEHLARIIAERLAGAAELGVRLSAVRVWETSGCAASYHP